MKGIPWIGRTMIGKKLLVALTGLVLLAFLIGHMTGNLKAMMGTDAQGIPEIDRYAEFLRTAGEPLVPAQFVLWTARIVLAVCLVVHVVLVIQLYRENRAARPIRYQVYRPKVSSLAARTMMVSGILILVFVVFHILHFTTGTIRLGQFEHGRVYANLYSSFSKPLVSIGYALMMVVVASHVFHGGWSFFQTWGLDNPDRNVWLRGLAKAIAVGLLIGFCLIPLLFWFGVLPPPPEVAGVATGR